MNIASLVKKAEAIVYGLSIATKIRLTQINIICHNMSDKLEYLFFSFQKNISNSEGL